VTKSQKLRKYFGSPVDVLYERRRSNCLRSRNEQLKIPCGTCRTVPTVLHQPIIRQSGKYCDRCCPQCAGPHIEQIGTCSNLLGKEK
jgi:hypothetical protein